MLGYFYDENGYIKHVDYVDEHSTGDYTTIMPSGFNKPKWNGTEWIEDMTDAELDEIHSQNTSQDPVATITEQLATLQSQVNTHNDANIANNATTLALIANLQSQIDALKGGA